MIAASNVAKGLLACSLLSICTGCKKTTGASLNACASCNETTWQTQSTSPDGQWIAIAHSEHTNHGFGGESVWTTVQLKQSFKDAEPVDVLTIEEDPEVVSNLKMSWPNSHLDITYSGGERVMFEAIKAFGQDITVERTNP